MTDEDPCAPLTVGPGGGPRLTFVAHGGQVLGWTPAGAGGSRLWLSPSYACGAGSAIRGGAPVVFPQFSDRGPLPKHGLARDRAWEGVSFGESRSEPGGAREESAFAVQRLRSDDATRAVWPFDFELTLRATAWPSALDLELVVRNPGPEQLPFTAALHSYLAVGASGASIRGLEGLPAEDNAAGRAPITMPSEPLDALARRDVAVRGATSPVLLDDPELGRLSATSTGFTDVVVWNPGPDHGLADVPAGAERGFVCVEPAVLTETVLLPGETWTGTHRLAVTPAG